MEWPVESNRSAPRPRWRPNRSALWLAIAIVSAALLTAGALVAAG